MEQTKENYENESIEVLFERAEEMAERLEDPELPLEQAFIEYERGIGVLRVLSEKISGVRSRVQELSKDGVLTDFEEERDGDSGD